tara:strand:+ start:822 stop:1232 length:411 start_codon:yes stop_codon:yes gene_type:complete
MKCKTCEGTGVIEINEQGLQYSNRCYLCDGVGEVVKCQPCNGLGEYISNGRFTPCLNCRGNGFNPKIVHYCKLCEQPNGNGNGILYTLTPDNYREDILVCREPCDCTIESLMKDKNGNNTEYYNEIHSIRRKYNGV